MVQKTKAKPDYTGPRISFNRQRLEEHGITVVDNFNEGFDLVFAHQDMPLEAWHSVQEQMGLTDDNLQELMDHAVELQMWSRIKRAVA